MADRVFVALDLETTGLDARSDAIIEVGAVRFAYDCHAAPFCYRVVDRFVTFINPQRPIPLRITQLTGIRDSDVADAPTIDRVIPELLAFVSVDVEAVVAHNASFDFGFLQAAGVNFHRPTQDTFELASILLPGMASYSLGELTRALEIPLPEAHRALDDAEAAAQLFTYLLRHIQELPPWIGRTLAGCGNEADWSPLSLFLRQRDALVAGTRPPPLAHASGQPGWEGVSESLLLDKAATSHTIPDEHLQMLFAANGPLHQTLGEHFEERQGQVDMAMRVLQALNTGDHLIIEAGTGTGKSIGYMLPAAMWSMANQRRVVIATNTIALQEQLLDKDIPYVRSIMAAAGYPAPQAILLKGRSNYLCTRRLYNWYQNRQLQAVELRVLAKVLVWLLETETGDVSELFLPVAAERMIWTRLCSDPATCSEERCGATGARGNFADFFLLARHAAETAHLLVVNHALLLADIAAGNRLLPPYAHVVIDEAHHLEDAATDQLSYRVDWSVAGATLQRLQRQGDLLQAACHHAAMQQDDEAERLADLIPNKAQQAAKQIKGFAQALVAFAKQQDAIRQDFGYGQRLGLDGRIRTQPAWSELEIEWDRVGQTLRGAVRQLTMLLNHLDQRQWWNKEPYAALYQELQGASEKLVALQNWLDRIMFQTPGSQDNDVVSWMEVNEAVSQATLVAAPLYVSDTLERELVHRKRSAIFTGATLRTGSGFGFIRDRLGLWDVTASTVDSPFDYRRSTLLFLPSDLPEPNDSRYQQAVEQAIIRAAVASSGATLALFTSYAQLRATAEVIRAPLDRLGITVLQHGTSSRQRLLREYRKADKAVLLGTRSFWEGIDLPGDELRCLLIVRLPFAVPSDPLVAARTAELENAFRDYTLPDAIIRFRQGFGRLIRRTTDRGVVVVLDSRVWRKEYGSAFLESLPECTTRHAPVANLDAEIDRWLNRESSGVRVRI